jgi:hypothetical protein
MSIDHSIPCPACDASARADDRVPCGICGGASRIGIYLRQDRPAFMGTRWLLADPDMPHPMVIAALDQVLDDGIMGAVRGISSLTLYRLGAVAGIRDLARDLGMWNGLEMELGETCEALLESWHYFAEAIAKDRANLRASMPVQEVP